MVNEYQDPIQESESPATFSTIEYRNDVAAPPLSLTDFLELNIPPVKYYVMDMLQRQGKSMISAAPNVGKSLFVQNMALDIVTFNQSPFMGKFDVFIANVLYLDLEMGEAALHERFKKMCTARGVKYIDNLYVKYIPALNLLDDSSKAQIETWLAELKIQVLILDPLGNAWAGDESKQEQVGKLTAYLNTLIEKYGISILVVHHWRKATKDFKSGGQMAAGSYKWEAWLDCHATLEGSPSSVTISCHKNRNRPRFSPFMVKLNSDTLSFDFLADYQKKHDEGTLEYLFDHFNQDRVSVPELIKYAKEQKACSETTLRDLIKQSKSFSIDTTGKTHYLSKKTQDIVFPFDEQSS